MKKNLLSLLLMSLVTLSVFAQSRKITGTVIGADDGQPIPGVSVKVAGSNVGTQTKVDGKFAITLPSGANSLDVSFIGYATQHVNITVASNYNIKLVSNTKQLTEVVVTDSYGVQAKKSYTGAASTVSADALNDKPFSTPIDALQGQVPGLNISQNTGQPGANIQVRLRGVGSISADSNPLYVVDGMIINAGDLSRLNTAGATNVLSGINEDDIETITVLKDASATAIYGSRASNGVIIITTKRGKAGNAQVNFDTEVGKSVNLPLPVGGRPMGGTDYANTFLQGLTNAGVTGAGQTPYITSYGLAGPYNDWYPLVTKQGQQQQYNVSVRGGSETSHVFASAGYFKQEASVIGSDLKRITGLLNVDQTISKSFTFSTGLNISNVQQNDPSNGGAFASPVLSAFFLRPQQQAYASDGTLNTSRATNTDFSSIYNPLYMVLNDKKFDSETRVLGNATMKWNIWDQLKYTTYFSGDLVELEEQQFNNPIMGDGRTAGGRGYDYYTRYFNYLFRNQLDYRYDFSKDNDFYVEASLGYEAQKSDGYFISANSNGYPATQPLLTASVNASTPTLGNSSFSGYTFDAFYTRGSINYKNKYSLSGSFRREGSSRFGSDVSFGNFYSIGAAWNVDEESFFKNQSILSSAKLRTSYGSVGNAGIGNYVAQPTAGYGAVYGGGVGQNFNTIGNTALTWESSKPLEFGADFGVLKDRLSFSVDYYIRKIDNLIQNVPISRTTGFSTVTENIGAMKNQGEEITIKASPIKSKDFQWYTSFNISFNKNTVTKLVNDASFLNGSFQVAEGQDFQTWYARGWAGVDPSNGDPLWYTDATKTATTNNYNKATPFAQYQADPKVFGGWTNTFSYKGFSISGDIYYNFGNYINDSWAFYLTDGTNYTFNKYAYDLNAWTTPGQITDVPKYVAGGGTAANGATYSSSSSFSSRFLYKGDYIRLKNLTVGYDFKGLSLLKKYGISKLYLYGRGTNLLTKTYDSRLPFDPEVGVNSTSNLEIPQVRTFTVGINLGL